MRPWDFLFERESIMPTVIELPDELVDEARASGLKESRTASEQIEHWAKVGKLVEENPDLPLGFLMDIMMARKSIKNGDYEEYPAG